ncbi:MAG TPA: hypothetical protein VMW27_14470, partial [Thermoanaerobaculia bacterium]|nr:hypothetical protein [Thermoanaerobaculia bacterium]
MRKAFACGLALSALGLVSPAFAGTVYVPVVDPAGSNGSTHSTEVWVSNAGTGSRSAASTFLAAGTNGTQRTNNPAQTAQVVAGRTLLLQGFGAAGKTGLLEIDTHAQVMVEARLKSTAPNGALSVSTLPVISSANAVQPNQSSHLLGLRRDADRGERSDFVLVNLAREGSLCTVEFYRSNGSQVGQDITLAVPALSSLYFTDAFGILGETNVSDARVQVTCNKQSFAYAPIFYASSSHYVFVAPSASGASTLGSSGSGGGGGGTTTTGAVVFERSGLIHIPTTANPKGIVDITVPRSMSLRRMVVDVDFIPGPWNRLKDPGNHAIIWIHRNIGAQEFRSNSVVNVNAFQNKIKMNQNVDLPGGNQTVAEKAVSWVQGQLYHVRYVYDAENASITATLTANGSQVATMAMAATANGSALRVEPGKLRTEFGHYDFQDGP